MDELDLLREFRRGAAAPSEDARRRASARLMKAIHGEHSRGSRVMRLIGKRRYSAVALAALAGATATALFVSAPWNESPGFLERAQAALTPSSETVLHYKWETTWTSEQFSCTVTHPPSEIWIDQTYPRRYRALLGHFRVAPSSDPRTEICSPGTPGEIGGDLTETPTLMFVPPDTLTFAPGQFRIAYDPVKMLREAISAGRAHHDGTTQLAGRTVERIRIDPPPPSDCRFPSCREPSYTYVDPETFYPVQTESPYGVIAPPGQAVTQFNIVERYPTFEYLPRTAANLALASIQAQHPDVTGPLHSKGSPNG